MASKDYIMDLIEIVESQNHKFVIGLVKDKKDDKSSDELEIFTNISDDPLNELLKVLKEHQRSQSKDNKTKKNDKK